MSYIDNIKYEIYYNALCIFRVTNNEQYIKKFNEIEYHLQFMLEMHAISEKTYNDLTKRIDSERHIYNIPYRN